MGQPVGDQPDHFPLGGQLTALAATRPVPAPRGYRPAYAAALMLVGDRFLWYVLGAYLVYFSRVWSLFLGKRGRQGGAAREQFSAGT